MAKRKKNLSITDTIAQHSETTPETTVIPEVAGVPEEKFQSAFEEEPKEEIIEKKEEKIEVKKEKEEKPKEEILISPHYKDSATSAINLGISSVL